MFDKRKAQREDMNQIIGLMREAFPRSSCFSEDYLDWLYWKNPAGGAVSLNAWEGNKIVGHLAAIPQKVVLHDKPTTVTLLLNVATAHSARGKGLFQDLVRELIKASKSEGHAAIIGVANQQTYRAYVSKLGFQDVAGLDADVELVPHDINCLLAVERAQLWHDWDQETLRWRMSNPNNPLRVVHISPNSLTIEGRSTIPFIRARAIIPRRGMDFPVTSQNYFPAVVLGMAPKGTLRRRLSLGIPNRLKPSPLRLVYVNLSVPTDKLDPNEILFSFLDFDAF